MGRPGHHLLPYRMVFLISCFLLSNLGGILATGILDLDDKKRGAGKWGYTAADGPATWAKNFPQYCAGFMQSPINIETDTAIETNVGRVMVENYTEAGPALVKNNGHSIKLEFTDKITKRPSIQGGRLPAGEKFEFAQVHWHWGSDDSQGSEHTLDGKQFPMEIHLVHFNLKYKTLGQAVAHTDGLAVLGFFYEVAKDDNKDLEGILKLAPKAGPAGSPLDNFKLSQLIPKDIAKYYYYKGGLTTPDCNQIVFWTNFVETIKISENQLDILREIGKKGDFNNNFRPVQKLNGRTVYTNKPGDCCTKKTVGGVQYELSSLPPGQDLPHSCLTSCVYTNPAGVAVCFRRGDKPVSCSDGGGHMTGHGDKKTTPAMAGHGLVI